MITWWHYLLLVNFYLLLFYSFYKVLLSKETFFQLNRVYLVSVSLLSFIIPLIQAEWIRDLFITQQVHQTIYAAANNSIIYNVKPVAAAPSITLGNVLTYVYLAGALALVCRLVYQLLLLKKLINKQTATTAFSFFKKLRISETLTDKETVVAHEQIHISQWHSADVLLMEAILIINWFNPVVYFYRKAIKQVHEYIADREVIQTGTSKGQYAILLLSQTFGTSPNQLTNNFFNQSLLKQRLLMLNQNESKKRALLKYGLSAPLFAGMLILSSATVNNSRIVNAIHNHAEDALAVNALKFISPQVKANNITQAALRAINTKSVKSVNQNSTIAASFHRDSLTAIVPSLTHTADGAPAFPGGNGGLYTFLQQNIHYHEKARETNTSGKAVINFVVEKDGSLTEIKILKNPGSGLGEEAERVLALSPKWSPGIQDGKTVRVQYTVPVNFSLPEDDSKKTLDSTAHQNFKIKLVYKAHSADSGKAINLAGLSNRQPSRLLIHSKQGSENQPIIVINGKQINNDNLSKIDPQHIRSITIIKNNRNAVKPAEKDSDGATDVNLKEINSLK